MKLISRNRDFYDGVLQSRRDGGFWKRESGYTWFNRVDRKPIAFTNRTTLYDDLPISDLVPFCQDNSHLIHEVIQNIFNTFPSIYAYGRTYIKERIVGRVTWESKCPERHWLAIGTKHYAITIKGIDFTAEVYESPPLLTPLQELFNTPLIMVGQSFEPTSSRNRNGKMSLVSAQDSLRMFPLIEINPVLANLAPKCPFDQFEVVQSIEQWFANRAVPEVIPEPSNEIKIQSHGFDKRSFRKEPTKRR